LGRPSGREDGFKMQINTEMMKTGVMA